jgi:hypothetical protein
MSGLYYLLFLVGVAVIAVWYVKNDKLGPGEPSKGLLRMKDDASPATDER